MKKITMFFAAMLFALVAFAETAAPIEVTSSEELKANVGVRVCWKNFEPKIVLQEGWFPGEFEKVKYTPDEGAQIYYEGQILPAKFDAYGTYIVEEDNGLAGFMIDSVATIQAFQTLGDLANFVDYYATEEQKIASYDVKEPVIVTYVDMQFGKFYVQYEYELNRGWNTVTMIGGLECYVPGGMELLSEGEEVVDPYSLQVGDKVLVRGVYTPAVMKAETDTLLAPATFAFETTTLVSKGNEFEKSTVVTVSQAKEEALSSYIKIKGGVVTRPMPNVYLVKYSDGDSLFVMPTSRLINLDMYIGAEAPELDKMLGGIFVYNPSFGNYMLYLIELIETKVYYDNIAALLAAGPQKDESIQQALKNPVLVTYFYDNYGAIEVFVEDETGALHLSSGFDPFETELAIGDLISGVSGSLNLRDYAGNPVLNCYDPLTYMPIDLVVESHDNEVVPTEVTIAELVADYEENASVSLSQWANRLVVVKDVTSVISEENENYGYLVQNEAKLDYSVYQWNESAYETYDRMNVTGIVDYSTINFASMYTIFPRSQADIEEVKEDDATNVELVEVANVYSENGLIVAEGEFQIFTVTGQNVTDMNGNLEGGVYVVRTANATAKVIVK